MLWLLRFLKGWVEFQIIGKFPERFINLAVRQGLGIFKAKPCGEYLSASLCAKEYKYIRSTAKKSGVKLRCKRKIGLPFFLIKHKNRKGLLIGAILFIVITSFMSNFIWSIEITGNQTVSKSNIINILEESGFKQGAFKPFINTNEVERSVLFNNDKIGWISVNIYGSCAQVCVKEKTSVPQSQVSTKPCNIKSLCDGVIVKAEVTRGESLIKEGSAVISGQLLVSGVVENELGESKLVDSDALILAKTQKTFKKELPKTVTYTLCENFKLRKSLDLFGVNIPFVFSSQYKDALRNVSYYRLYLTNNSVPVTVKSEQSFILSKNRVELRPQQAQQNLKASCALYMLFELSDCQSVLKTESFDIGNEGYTYLAEFSCVEDIGLKENIIVN